MEHLLGPKVLTRNGGYKNTSNALDGKDLVLLYFSASWCPPCRSFTPLLTKFYERCCVPNAAEIIFVSSDKDDSSFHDYFGKMPWLAIGRDAHGLIIQQKLLAKLKISTLPSLIILDALTGHFISNTARNDVMAAANDTEMGMKFIQSWKKVNPVPIEDANLGLFSSFMSAVNRTMDYVISPSIDDHGSKSVECIQTASLSSTTQDIKTIPATVPASLLLRFFKETTLQLQHHPVEDTQQQLLVPNFIHDAYNSDARKDQVGEQEIQGQLIPAPLQVHRQLLLHVQIKTLNSVLLQFNQQSKDKVSLEEAQSCLRQVGSNDLSGINISSGNEKGELLSSMLEMNDQARLAFARSVLWAELEWDKQYSLEVLNGEFDRTKQTQDGKMIRNLRHTEDGLGALNRSVILDFSGLCQAAVRLAEVSRHLSDGSDIFPLETNVDGNFDRKDSNQFNQQQERKLPQHRILYLQHIMFRAVGCDPEFGASELRKLMTLNQAMHNDSEKEDDKELVQAIVGFLTAMRDAGTKATFEVSSVQSNLSDADEGGFTRVVSVNYSEKTLDVNNNFDGSAAAVSQDVSQSVEMEHQADIRQRQALLMARQAAVLQQSVLGELLLMEEDKREERLLEAKVVRDEFMKEAQDIPAGAERIRFIQSVGAEKQRMLVMIKLWEKLLAENDGKPPTLIRNM